MRLSLTMNKTKQTVFFAIMLSLSVTLTALEHSLPPIPFMPPGLRLGLSNIVTMYCVFFVGFKRAAALNVFKSLFVFITRGSVAFALSLCGGLLSVCVIIALAHIFKKKISYAAVSVAGAITHNIGQYAAVSAITAPFYFVYYLPVLIVSGIFMGLATGAVLKAVLFKY